MNIIKKVALVIVGALVAREAIGVILVIARKESPVETAEDFERNFAFESEGEELLNWGMER